MIRYAVLALGLTIASATPGATQQSAVEQRQQDRLAKALAGLTPGKPVHCLSHHDVTSLKAYGNTIVYTQGRNRKWINDTGGGCSRLDDDLIVSRTTMSQYCRGDIIETRDRTGGMTTGVCSLGEFVPYSK
ncbi:MAG: hypothetical protein V4574_18900 [Pseudomonadota bacterium]